MEKLQHLYRKIKVLSNDKMYENEFKLKTIKLIETIENNFYNRIGKLLINNATPNLESSYIKDYLIKPVSDSCNLRCSYCYEDPNYFEASNKKISQQKLVDIIKNILSTNQNVAKFSWHGGEPLLLGIEFYKEVIKLQKKYNINNANIINSIQTNATLLNEEWYEFIIKNDFKLSISFDGVKEVHDLFRYNSKKEGSYDLVVEKIQDLNSNNIPFHLISVVNHEHKNLGRDYYKTIKDLKIKSFDIHPNFKHFNNYTDPIIFSSFIIDVFNEWKMDLELRDFHIYTDFLKAVVTGKQDTCYFNGRCTEIVAIDGNGDFIPCTRPFSKDLFTFGNISNVNLTKILNNENFNLFKDKNTLSFETSNNCKWQEICMNGCPQHRVKNNKADVEGHSVFCNCEVPEKGGYYNIWDYFYHELSNEF